MSAPAPSSIGTRDWIRRRSPSWVLELASATSAVIGLAAGAHGGARLVCWFLAVLEGGLLVATVAALWRLRRVLRARFARGDAGTYQPLRRAVRAEGLFLGGLAVVAGIDLTYTYRVRAVGLALVFFGAQLLYDRRARR